MAVEDFENSLYTKHLRVWVHAPGGVSVFVMVCAGVCVCERVCSCVWVDDDCFHYHSWRNNVVTTFGILSSFLTWLQ